jgi:hypothetical protein
MAMMTISDFGRISKIAIAVQLVIIAGVLIFLKVYVPRAEKTRAAADLKSRESRIERFFNSTVAEDAGRTVASPDGSQAHPQSLRSTPSVEEVQRALGGPDTSMTDYAGALHLTWIGTDHSLTAAFNHGRLYCLTLTDRRTGHGVNVYESSANWQPF